VTGKDGPQRPADLARRKRSGSDLVEQRLKQVEVAAVDQGDIYGRASERTGRVQAAESSSKNDDALVDDFSISWSYAAAGIKPNPGFAGRINFPFSTRTPR
jgi:hypothetical protein